MKIKIENNRVIVAQKTQEDLTEYYTANQTEEQIINMANANNCSAQINGAYYHAEDNADYQAERAETEKQFIRNDLQAQIGVIDKKRVRALCEPQLKDSETGETWLGFYTGQVLVLRDKITEIRKGE